MMDVVACFGDSLIEGFPFGTECSWCAAAEFGTKFRLLNFGVCGECCNDILYRLKNTELPGNLKGIIFMGGANDGLCGRKVQNDLADIINARDYALNKKLKFAVVLPLISSDLVLNKSLAELTDLLKQQELYLIDLQSGIGYSRDELVTAYVDGIHPNAMTYYRMGEVARPQIERWLWRK